MAAAHAEQLCRRWELTPLAPAGDGVQSLVLHAATAGGASVVMKVPRSPESGAREHAVLAAWAGAPVPRVEAFDPFTGALLLEQLEQATNGYTPDELVRLARRLHLRPPPGTDPAQRTCHRLLRAAQGHHSGLETCRRHRADLKAAEETMSALASEQPQVLLHGDLLHKNLLATPAGLHAIDPQPVAGPAELELARWVAWGGADGVTSFDELIEELLLADAGALGGDRLDRGRLVSWTWAVSVCENKPGRAGEGPRATFLDEHRDHARLSR